MFIRPLADDERLQLEADRRTAGAFRVRRAQIVLASARRLPPKPIAQLVGCSVQTVRNVLHAFNPSMWPPLSSPLEHFFLSLSPLLLSWCAVDLAAHIRVASAREVASRLTRPVIVSASCVPRTRRLCRNFHLSRFAI